MRGNRFWEFYLVRYLLGTIFGVVVLFYLVINYNNQITASFFESEIPSKIEKIECKDKQISGDKLECKEKEKQKAEELLNAGDSLGAVRMLPDEEKISAKIASLLYETTYDLGKKDVIDILKTLSSTDQNSSKNIAENIQLKQTGFPILATIVLVVSGFLYMYFSSMVILVLHGIRSVLFHKFFDKIKISQQKFIVLILGVLVVLIFMYFIRSSNNDIPRHCVSIILTLLVFGSMKVNYLSVLKFYNDLSLFRSKTSHKQSTIEIKEISLKGFKQTTSYAESSNDPSSETGQEERKEYIESYKHLREHGNAFGIIICELIFAAWLIFWNFSYWSIFYWCLIGFSSWILGTYLEYGGVISANRRKLS
ncbi:hypothetical protein HQN90_11115 [Paenibacillus alba]|uniref:hypothetical protein n=1 Tax=Paenibacillus alba TaxID=1197127 RepID=UPI00156460CF|nr:hypothetical protein [Paenibacillus alba]NQX66677.1 hypothetical protein [Paenibacillus alba]